MEKKAGYRTITYRFHLYPEQMDWIVETKKMYNKVLSFFYDVLSKEPELWSVPKLRRMRELEFLTIGTKEQLEEDVKYPIPYEKVPLYFRRAAINDAIRLQESFRSGKENGAKPAESFNASPIYYKGMYKELTETEVKLKLYTGAEWKWITCGIDTCGRELPGEEQMYSPTLVMNNGYVMLHVPVKMEVEDIRTVKERMTDAEKICAVYFPKEDVLAVAVILSTEGKFLESRFIRGGKELNHRRKWLLNRIEQSRDCQGGEKDNLPLDENKNLKEKIHNITEDVAHLISRELVDFCTERNVSIIVVPKYSANKDFVGSPYAIANSVDWIGRRIISYVRYKSFGNGIVTASVSTKKLTKQCYICGADIKKDKKTYVCANGHKGNMWFNIAMNEGIRFLEMYGGGLEAQGANAHGAENRKIQD